jgi:hypothetical protein
MNQLVVTPTARWIDQAIASCRYSVDIVSPFVGPALVEFCHPLAVGVKKTLLTRTRLQDFASGASNLPTVISAARAGFTINGLHRLHAKVYLFDDRLALITSANATFSGLRQNGECGVTIDDQHMIDELRGHIRTGFGDSAQPVVWQADQLEALIPAVDLVRRRLTTNARLSALQDDAAAEFDLPRADAEDLLAATAKWTQLVFRGVLRLRKDEFTTQDVVDSCRQAIEQEFPANRHSRQKIRQQLQILRDLGLVRFLTRGRYQLVVRVTQ